MADVSYQQDADGTWVVTYVAPDPPYRAGLIGTGRTKEAALYNLTTNDEGMRALALAATSPGGGGPEPEVVYLKFGAIYDALLSDGWAVVGRVPRFDGVGGTIATVLRKTGHPDFLADGGREEFVGPVRAAAIAAATGLDLDTIEP